LQISLVLETGRYNIPEVSLIPVVINIYTKECTKNISHTV
jgi:hypothetical protein